MRTANDRFRQDIKLENMNDNMMRHLQIGFLKLTTGRRANVLTTVDLNFLAGSFTPNEFNAFCRLAQAI